jgi:hypothetical protein
MFSVREWKRRIAWFMGAARRHPSYCGTKQTIIGRLDGLNDPNASLAFDEMVQDRLIELHDKKYVKNFDKASEFDALVNEESEEELAKIQPEHSEFKDLVHRFTRGSQWQGNNQKIHYYCVLKDDPACWIVLAKNKAAGKAGRLRLGGFENPKDRLARIWSACKMAAKANGSQFIRFDVEKIDLEACGTSREYSRAALNIFKELGLIKTVGHKSRAEVYALTGREPDKSNLDRFTGQGK